MKHLLYLLLALTFLPGSPARAQQSKVLTVAFGSCNRVELPQPLWPAIGREKPDVWVWLGDNIYGDTNDMQALQAKYIAQLNQPGYRQFRQQVPNIIGTWDDHDYGRNDAGKEYPFKQQSQQLALDFLQEPRESARRKQQGLYAAYTYRLGKKKVKVILLDNRYFLDPLERGFARNYLPSPTGDILGADQWQWLKQQLTGSDADVHIIGSGIQFLAQEHPYEKWANFPAARQRLLSLLVSSRAKGVILLSGDRHIGEMSKITLAGRAQPIYEITASGLTHSATQNAGEPNQYRVGPLVNQKHYGVLRFRQQGKKLLVTAALKGEDDQEFYSQEIEVN
ncbi:alkaline phosphatase D family protein [Hymenobacter cellulosilyticus]|uniref:Alkaline phosphatase family protein n=1 Tax=Hymenobacter cellulosilyticus TaxID=2932248 RepID=A0A8T9Q808_9BACT|nr:alkaline phosphatase D family protein [Hymenobacter cellulosilyticus]UOQ71910.1 alkaline phosphatase family protein [Hymenobacter cellulosilyticus]